MLHITLGERLDIFKIEEQCDVARLHLLRIINLIIALNLLASLPTITIRMHASLTYYYYY